MDFDQRDCYAILKDMYNDPTSTELLSFDLSDLRTLGKCSTKNLPWKLPELHRHGTIVRERTNKDKTTLNFRDYTDNDIGSIYKNCYHGQTLFSVKKAKKRMHEYYYPKQKIPPQSISICMFNDPEFLRYMQKHIFEKLRKTQIVPDEYSMLHKIIPKKERNVARVEEVIHDQRQSLLLRKKRKSFL